MSVKEVLDGISEDFVSVCVNYPRMGTFRKRVKADYKLKRAYEGRVLYELLQNADDACVGVDISKSKVLIELKGNVLSIKNNGEPFTSTTINSLCQGEMGEKDISKYIGGKGIGFRSVLNYADEIYIYSGKSGSDYYSVRFSKKYAEEKYDLIRDLPHIKDEIKALQKDELRINPVEFPILAVPEFVDPIEKDFDTVIQLILKPDQKDALYKSMARDMRNFDKNVLLFLPHVNEIEFLIETEKIEFTRDVVGNRYTIQKKVNDCTVLTECYELYSTEEEIELPSGTKSAKFAVAIPTEGCVENSCLYTFFPVLNVESPLPAVLHGTFHLTANRNSLDEDYVAENKIVFERMLAFYVRTIVNHVDGNRRLRLLQPTRLSDSKKEEFFFHGGLSLFNPKNERGKRIPELERTYISLCAKERVFFTVTGEYLRSIDKPVVCSKNPPSELKKAPFYKLVQFIPDELLQIWALKLIGGDVDDRGESYLKECIDSVSEGWAPEVRVRIFKWWFESKYSALPKLLKYRTESDEEFITSQKDPCFLSGSITDVPPWAKIYVLAEKDEEELLKVFSEEIQKNNSAKDNEKRVLPRILGDSLLNIQEQSSRVSLISPVNSSVNGDYEKSVEFVKWLWGIWNTEPFAEAVKKVKFNLPTKDNQVKEAEKIYMGVDYKNEIGETFFSCDPSYSPLANILLSFEPSEWQKQEFYVALGVHFYPKVFFETFKELKPDAIIGERDEIKYVRRFILRFWIKVSSSFPKEVKVTFFNAKLHSISNICSILNGSNATNDWYLKILKWITLDNELKFLLSSDKEIGEGYIEYKPRIQHQKNCFTLAPTGDNPCPSFLHYLFSSLRWIPIDGKMYAPSKIVITDDETLKSLKYPCLTESDLDKIVKKIGCNKDEIKNILSCLGAKKTLLNLSSTDFYQLLLDLPRLPGSERISRQIYKAIIENGKDGKNKETAFFEDSDNKTLFFEKGYVLAKNRADSKSEYRLAKDVYFSSSAVLNFDNVYFIDVPPRSGQKEDFRTILNVNSFVQSYSLLCSPELSPCDGDFQDDFDNFLPYLLTYRSGIKDIAKDISIRLIKSAKIKWNGNDKDVLGDYQLLRDRNSWYICVGDVKKYAYLQKEKIADALEQVFNVVFNFPAKEFLNHINPLFIYTPEQRAHLVESDFGSTEEFERTKDEIRKSESIREIIKRRLNEDGLLSPDVVAKIDELDWYALSSFASQRDLSNLLRMIGRDVDYLNSFVARDFSLYNYHSILFSKAFDEKKDLLELKIYNCLKNSGDKRKTLRDHWWSLADNIEQYKIAEKNGKMNSVSFNAESAVDEIGKQYLEMTGLTCDEPNFVESMDDVKAVYNRNMDALRKIAGKKNDSLLHMFTNDAENDSMLFFESSETISQMFNSFVEANGSKIEKTIDFSPDKIRALLEATKIGAGVKKGSPKVPGQSSGRGKSMPGDNTSEENKKITGGAAEYLVVIKLAERKIDYVNDYFSDVGGYDVKWVSGYAKRFERLPEDKYDYDATQIDEKAGYDIELMSKDKSKRMFIEVKSSSSDGCSVLMSSNEYDKAAELETEFSLYRLAFVTGLSKNEPHIDIIPEPLHDKSVFDTIPTHYNVIYMRDSYQKESEETESSGEKIDS